MSDGPRIELSDTGFAFLDGTAPGFTAAFADIARVNAWQRDMAMHDEVCVEIVRGDGESFAMAETLPGFRALMDRLERLPGFDPHWWDKVILPPFASNELVAYVRDAPRETS